MINLKYIVTGTGRCGTLFMANLLNSLDTPCTHEAIFNYRGLEHALDTLKEGVVPESSPISNGNLEINQEEEVVAESSYMAAPFLKEFDCEIIHVVRNPLCVLSSFLGTNFNYFLNAFPSSDERNIEYETFIYSHVEELKEEMSEIDRAFLFYLKWNEMIENSGKVKIRHRIEDEPNKIKELLKKGEKESCYSNFSCNKVDQFKRVVNLCEIENKSLREKIKNMMIRYGYDPEKPYRNINLV